MPATESDIVKLAKYTVDLLTAGIPPESGEPSVVVARRWKRRDSDKNLELMSQRHVDVWHSTYADNGPATREEGYFSVTLSVVVCERYQPKEEIPEEWIDDLVNWTEQYVFNVLDATAENIEGVDTLRLGDWWTQNLVMTVVCDPDLLRTQKVFWSEVELTYTRLKG